MDYMLWYWAAKVTVENVDNSGSSRWQDISSKQFIAAVASAWGATWAHWHDDVIKWEDFPHYWPFVRGIHRSPVNSLQKGQWRWALVVIFYLRKNTRLCKQSRHGDLRRHPAHYDVGVMGVWWNGWHCALCRQEHLKCIFLNGHLNILIQISWMLVPGVLIDNYKAHLIIYHNCAKQPPKLYDNHVHWHKTAAAEMASIMIWKP